MERERERERERALSATNNMCVCLCVYIHFQGACVYTIDMRIYAYISFQGSYLNLKYS